MIITRLFQITTGLTMPPTVDHYITEYLKCRNKLKSIKGEFKQRSNDPMFKKTRRQAEQYRGKWIRKTRRATERLTEFLCRLREREIKNYLKEKKLDSEEREQTLDDYAQEARRLRRIQEKEERDEEFAARMRERQREGELTCGFLSTDTELDDSDEEEYEEEEWQAFRRGPVEVGRKESGSILDPEFYENILDQTGSKGKPQDAAKDPGRGPGKRPRNPSSSSGTSFTDTEEGRPVKALNTSTKTPPGARGSGPSGPSGSSGSGKGKSVPGKSLVKGEAVKSPTAVPKRRPGRPVGSKNKKKK